MIKTATATTTGSWRQAALPPAQQRYPTLDLHGCTKSQAIRRLTDFLDWHRTKATKNKSWLCIITGSGAHSQEGPILRNAVQALLHKRHIEHQLNEKGRGSFLVNAQSGIVLYARQPEYTKVVVVDIAPGEHVKIVGRPAPSTVSAFIHQKDAQLSSLQNDALVDYPLLPKQPPRSVNQLQIHKHAKINKDVRHQLTRVLSDSALEYDRHVQLEKGEEEQWLQAVEQSKLEPRKSDLERDEEERVFQEMLVASAADLKHREDQEELQFQEMLAISSAEVMTPNDDDSSLEAVLKMSLLETATTRCNDAEDEDEALRLALEQSLGEV